MSSGEVRTAFNAAVTAAASPWAVFNLSDYVSLDDCLGEIDSQAVLIQYVASSEEPVSIAGGNLHGWSEDGSVVLHLVIPSGFDSAPVVTKGDEIRTALRGTRLNSEITVRSVDPFTDFSGLGLYGAAWKGWSSNVFINRRDCG